MKKLMLSFGLLSELHCHYYNYYCNISYKHLSDLCLNYVIFCSHFSHVSKSCLYLVPNSKQRFKIINLIRETRKRKTDWNRVTLITATIAILTVKIFLLLPHFHMKAVDPASFARWCLVPTSTVDSRDRRVWHLHAERMYPM